MASNCRPPRLQKTGKLSNSAELQPDPASSESECELKDPKPLLLSQNRRVPNLQHPAEMLLHSSYRSSQWSSPPNPPTQQIKKLSSSWTEDKSFERKRSVSKTALLLHALVQFLGLRQNRSNCRNAAWSSNWADVVDLATAFFFLSFQSTDNQSPQEHLTSTHCTYTHTNHDKTQTATATETLEP